MTQKTSGSESADAGRARGSHADKSAVILFSHGSLLCGAGQPLEQHAERLREMPGFEMVEIGYLNYSSPSFEEAVETVARAGAVDVIVAPFFLVTGYFVSVNLPRLLTEVKARFPNLNFTVAEPVGSDPLLADAVIASARSARPPANWREYLVEAGRSCRMRSDCPNYGEPGCRANNDDFVETAPHSGPDFTPAQLAESALLILAHGSPHADANEPTYTIADILRERRIFKYITLGFLECNDPSIPDAISACMASGARRVIAAPFFLHAGNHVAIDLPDALDEARASYPNMEFALGDFLGNLSQVTDVVAKRIKEARSAAGRG